MPVYDYQCECGYRFEEYYRMDDRHKALCPICGRSAKLRISLTSFRFAEPITFFQELPGGKGYQETGWKPDSGILPKPGQPYKTAKEVEKEEYGGIKEI